MGKLKISSLFIDGYASLKDLRFEPSDFAVLIGANGQGKSLIFEALNRFFSDFNPVGGLAVGVSDSLWFKRETEVAIRFEIKLTLRDDEVSLYLPLGKSLVDKLDINAVGDLHKLKVSRLLPSQGNWKTESIQWGNIPLVSNDVLISPDKVLPMLKTISLGESVMYFFTQNYSKENVGGDRLLVDSKSKKAFASTPQIDEAVRSGHISSSVEFAGQNFQQWAIQKGLAITQPTPDDLASLGIISPEKIQQLITSLSGIRGKFRLIPAARDIRAPPGQRASLLDNTTLQNITNMSIDRRRQMEKRWEQFRTEMQQLLGRRLEPNPTQVLVKEGDLGLLPSEVGGGEQSIMGLVFETMEANSVIAVEEPENHLHPRLQSLLLSYLRGLAEATQVLVSTHSAIFASKLDVGSVFVVSRDEGGRTQAESVNESNVGRIIDELGIRPADLLEYDSVVFVEGQDDVKIFGAWAGILAKSSEYNVGFIEAQGWNNMDYYANARVLQSKRIRLTPYVVFDGDTEKDEKRRPIKEKLLKELKLPQGNIFTLQQNSIEDYLAVPQAIGRAFPLMTMSRVEIAEFLETNKGKKNRKTVLDALFRRGGLDGYDGDKGARIARVMLEREIPDEIKGFFKQIGGKAPEMPSVTSGSSDPQ